MPLLQVVWLNIYHQKPRGKKQISNKNIISDHSQATSFFLLWLGLQLYRRLLLQPEVCRNQGAHANKQGDHTRRCSCTESSVAIIPSPCGANKHGCHKQSRHGTLEIGWDKADWNLAQMASHKQPCASSAALKCTRL